MKKLFVAAAFGLPALAHAHGVAEGATTFMHGFWHPLFGLDHLLALIAGGVWMSRLALRHRLIAMAVFAAITLLAGVVAGSMGFHPQEWAIVATLVVLPTLMVVTRQWYNKWAVGLMTSAAALHAAVHGAELAGGAGVASAMLGTVIGSLMVLIVASSLAIGLVHFVKTALPKHFQ